MFLLIYYQKRTWKFQLSLYITNKFSQVLLSVLNVKLKRSFIRISKKNDIISFYLMSLKYIISAAQTQIETAITG